MAIPNVSPSPLHKVNESTHPTSGNMPMLIALMMTARHYGTLAVVRIRDQCATYV
jgi:hypothetical protein